MPKNGLVAIVVVVVTLAGATSKAYAQTPCANLKSLRVAGMTITAAESINGGPLLPAGLPSAAMQQPKTLLPAYCRLAAVLTPSPDSHIEMELWMPTSGWNEKFLAVGNGGWAGAINLTGMIAALQEAYATASTDTGHSGGDGAFAVGHPEKVLDFAYRAVHEMTEKSKAIMTAFYGRGPQLSYWRGCSTGGSQGLVAAQRYPEDFDGIIAGAPANQQAHLSGWRLSMETTLRKNPPMAIPPAKLTLWNQAVLAACDGLDGVTDGLLADPRRCHFDPSVLLCKGAPSNDCLTAPQVEAAKMAYAPARKKTGDLVYPGLVPGGESGWSMFSAGTTEPGVIDVGMYRYVVHQDTTWDWRTFDLNRDIELADERGGFIGNVPPDLRAFKARGGKLLIYHGWNDGGAGGAISPQSSIDFYASVLARMGPGQGDWLRLFMVPGMAHCGGGPGPNQFAALEALRSWREAGIPPDDITAYHVTGNRVDMTRPLCPFPQVAVYKGTGSTNDAASFVCRVP